MRSNVVLAGVNGAAETPPMAGIEDARNIVTQLHEITAVLDRDDRGDGVFAVQRAIVGQEMFGAAFGRDCQRLKWLSTLTIALVQSAASELP